MLRFAGIVALLGGVGGALTLAIWFTQVQNSIQTNPLIVWLQELPTYDWIILLVSVMVLLIIMLRPKPRRRRGR